MTIILLISTIQAWFFTLLILVFKKPKLQSDYLLSAWLFIIGFHTLNSYLFSENIFNYIGFALISVAVPFLQGPFLYLYIRTREFPNKTLRLLDFIHFLPFFFFVASQFFSYYYLSLVKNGHQNPGFSGFFESLSLFNLFFLVSLPIYIFYTTKILKKGKHSGRENSGWLYSLIIFVGLIWLSSMISFFFPFEIPHQNQANFNYLVFVVLTGFVYLISSFGFKGSIFQTDIPNIVQPKYSKSGLSEEERQLIWEKLNLLMNEEKPYIDPKISLKELATLIDTSPNKLSQVINTMSGFNFNDYINNFRVSIAKKMLLNKTFDHYSLLGIAYEAGFSSKATFNRAFLKFEGQNPSKIRTRNE